MAKCNKLATAVEQEINNHLIPHTQTGSNASMVEQDYQNLILP